MVVGKAKLVEKMSTESSKTRKIFDGRYEIVSIVGRGAASVVYHGRRATAPYADVAIKVLTDKGASVPAKERLRKEALAMLYARHRYVVRLDDFRSVGDLCYLSMEFAPHRDLRVYLTEHGDKCTPVQRERYFTQAAEALGYVHRAGLIHRDIKPDNILVMNEAEIRIADFGVAVLPSDEAALSDLQRGVGTMEYLAPEVLDGIRCDQRSDVYSLGVTFYELLAGTHPFSGAPLAEQLDIRRDGSFAELAQIAPHVPDYINSAIMRCLAFDANARFENGQQLFESLLLGRDKSKRKTKNRARASSLAKSSTVGSAAGGHSALGSSDFESELASELSVAANSQDSAQDMGTSLPPQLAVGELVGGEQDILAERDVARETVLIPREEVAAARGNDPQNVERAVSPTLTSPTEQIAGARRETVIQIKSLNHQQSRSATTTFQRNSIPGLEQMGSGEPVSNSAKQDLLTTLREKAAGALDGLALKIEEIQANPNTKKYIPIGAVMVTFLLGVVLFSAGSGLHKKPVEAPDAINTSIRGPQSQLANLSFPKLEPGRYEGRIQGLIPGKTTALAFIVPSDASAVITLVGVDGWSPVLGRYPAGATPDKLRVSSNGFLVDFTGQVDGDAIVGYFHDLSTGSQGRWEARLAR